MFARISAPRLVSALLFGLAVSASASPEALVEFPSGIGPRHPTFFPVEVTVEAPGDWVDGEFVQNWHVLARGTFLPVRAFPTGQLVFVPTDPKVQAALDAFRLRSPGRLSPVVQVQLPDGLLTRFVIPKNEGFGLVPQNTDDVLWSLENTMKRTPEFEGLSLGPADAAPAADPEAEGTTFLGNGPI